MIDRLPVTLALSQLLTDATGLAVGRGRQPVNTAPPYLLLYSIDTEVSGAPFTDLNEDACFTYQVTCVSGPDPAVPSSTGVEDQAEWMRDKVLAAILGRDPVTRQWLHPLTVPGNRVIGRTPDIEAGGTNDPADGIMGYALRFKVDLSPA